MGCLSKELVPTPLVEKWMQLTRLLCKKEPFLLVFKVGRAGGTFSIMY